MLALHFDTALTLREDYPQPVAASGEVLVKVLKSGICNTDLEIARGYMGFQGIPGHEFVGIVEGGDWHGRRIAGEINVSCGDCLMCQRGIHSQCSNRTTVGIDRYNGSFARWMVLPAANLHALPDEITDDEAIFIEPLAAALQTLEQTHVRPTDRVILIGAGKLGLLVAQIVSLNGCRLTVIARHPRQRQLLAMWGIESAAPGEVEAHRADIVIDCTGTAEGFADALKLVRPRGIIHLKSTYHGLPQADLTRVVIDEVSIISSRCGPFDAAIDLLRRGHVDVTSLIDAHYPLRDGLTAFQKAGEKGVLKIILDIA